MKKGIALIYVIFFITIMFTMSLILTYIIDKRNKINRQIVISKQTYYLALSGIERAKNELTKNPAWRTGFSNEPFINISGDTIGYYTVYFDTNPTDSNLIHIYSIGNIKYYYDTIIIEAEAQSGKINFLKNVLAADTGGINNDSFGIVKDGNIHSNSFLNTSPYITYSNITYSSVSSGDNYQTRPGFDDIDYRTEANSMGNYINNDFEFRENQVYNGVYYVNGDVTIGGRKWWDFNWKYRKKLLIRNTNLWNVQAEKDYTVKIDLDTNSLINAGQLRPDLNDLRVVWYKPGGGGNDYRELDRDYVNQGMDRGIWFALEERLDAGVTDDRYYIYYGNNSAGPAPQDKDKIYLWYDDFSSNTIGDYHLGRHLELHGNGNSNMTYDNINKLLRFNTGDNRDAGIRPRGAKFKNQKNLLIQGEVTVTGVYPNNGTFGLSTKWRHRDENTLAHISNGTYNSPQIGIDGTMNGLINDPPGNFYFPADGSVAKFKYASGMRADFFGWQWTNYYFWVNEILRASSTWNTTYSNKEGKFVFEASQQTGTLDNILARMFIWPEPSVIEVNEGNTTINGTVIATGNIILTGELSNRITRFNDTYPALISLNEINFMDTSDTTSGDNRPKINGLILANSNIYIDNIYIIGAIYGYSVNTYHNVSIHYDTGMNTNPYLNPPPYFDTTEDSLVFKRWYEKK